MILLDGIDTKPDDACGPKLAAEASTSVPVARPHTPTPSLPDYEASQAQLRPTTLSYPELKEKRTRRRRWRRYAVVVLAAYFLLTVVIGIPIIVVKLRKRTSIKSNPYQPWEGAPPAITNSITLGDAPLRISAAKSCNAWTIQDRREGDLFLYQLNYSIPTNRSVFLNTNISYASNSTYLNQFSGSLLVDINDDPSVDEGIVFVSMLTTTTQLANETHVCQMLTGQGSGVYIFAPKALNQTDALSFNITLLLPRSASPPRYVPQLLCHLPHFQHTYGQLDPAVNFGSVIFGGAMSGVFVQSIQASAVTVKASTAEIRGSFRVDELLSLETVSAPIYADVHLTNNNVPRSPTYMRLTTGNSVLNANVTVYTAPPSTDDSDSDDEQDGPLPHGPHFIAQMETFNAPLNVSIAHDPATSPVNMQVRASNNLGNTRVTLDPIYSGTFDVNTMFAQADVLTWNGASFNEHYDDSDSSGEDEDEDSDDSSNSTSASASATAGPHRRSPSPPPPDDYPSLDPIGKIVDKGKIRMFLPNYIASSTSVAGTAPTDPSGRCLEYDLISSSQIRGWVGIPPRPMPDPFGWKTANTSHVEVVSSLSGAQLLIRS